jgi:hypothetical protein
MKRRVQTELCGAITLGPFQPKHPRWDPMLHSFHILVTNCGLTHRLLSTDNKRVSESHGFAYN